MTNGTLVFLALLIAALVAITTSNLWMLGAWH